ncbi:MAG TPA: serine/threonine-protein kinase, partial [Thermomicrobiales bacterium]|nr:serine/threonine-protein kinase [Thermomicrobiales bacterium]
MAADEANPNEPADGGARRLQATIGGRYRIDLDAPLGASGINLVYLGVDIRTRQPVAVKTLRLEYRQNPETRARFRSEARLLAFLNHPNVVRVLAVVEERSAPWVVLEHRPGQTVRELLAERGALTPEEVVPILEQTASALDHLHARGLVHLAIEPHNLLVGNDGSLQVTDFGHAQPAGQPQQIAAGHAFGSAAYLAPEQASGEPVGAAADIYALGCVVYELLTGAPPFVAADAASRNDLIRARLAGPPPAPTALRPDLRLPRWIDDVVLLALARDPNARYGDAVSFARLYRSWVEGEDAPPFGPAPAGPVRQSEREAALAALRTRPAGHRAPVAAPISPAPAAPLEGEVRPLSDPFASDSSSFDRFDRIGRWLWAAVIALLIVDLAVGAALVATQGRLPPIYEPAAVLRPGGVALVAAGDATLRAGPSAASAAVGPLPRGARVTLGAAPLETSEGVWWPVAHDG